MRFSLSLERSDKPKEEHLGLTLAEILFLRFRRLCDERSEVTRHGTLKSMRRPHCPQDNPRKKEEAQTSLTGIFP